MLESWQLCAKCYTAPAFIFCLAALVRFLVKPWCGGLGALMFFPKPDTAALSASPLSTPYFSLDQFPTLGLPSQYSVFSRL